MKNPTWDRVVLDAKHLCAAVRQRDCRAYQFADSFDNYSNASEMYESVTGSVLYSSSYARFAPPAGLPGQGVKFASGGACVIKNMQSNQQTFIKKVAVEFASLGGSSSVGNPFLGVLDSSTYQWCLAVFPSGALAIIHSGTGPVEVQSGPGAVATNQYYGIEVQVTINGSSSTAQVWVNGVQVINAIGLNLQASADAYGNRVSLGDLSDNGLSGMFADDFRVWDNTGSTQNAALGSIAQDSRLVTKMPSGAGASASFTPNGAAANWQCVDDNPPDGDTSYVSGASSGLIDSYAMPSAGLTASPVMVVARAYARKDDGATRSLEVGVSSSGSTAYGPSVTVGSTYAFVDGCIADDPHTSAAWTAAGADAAQHSKQETA